MKRQIVVFASAAMFAVAIATQSVTPVLAQQFAEGPVGELNSPSLGNFGSLDDVGSIFGGSDVGGAAIASSPNVVYTPKGEAIELFNPSVPLQPVSQPTPNLLAAPVSDPNTKTDWITLDGRINLENGSPESQLWSPNGPAATGWQDGPLGLQVGIDWLFFSRGLSGASIFQVDDSNNVVPLADFDFDIESTPRYRIGVASEFGTGYEFVHYDFKTFMGSLSVDGQDTIPVFFGLVPVEQVDSYLGTYESRIKNFELNVWARRSQRLRVGYGLRYFSIEENYDITVVEDDGSGTTSATGTDETGFFSATDNDLFGGQIMLELYRPMTTATSLNGGVKGMLLNNNAKINVDTLNNDATGEDSFITGGVNFWGGVTYRPFRGVSLQAGYEGVFIGSVATGTSQSENVTANGFSENVSPIGEGLYFGGGYVGGTVTF